LLGRFGVSGLRKRLGSPLFYQTAYLEEVTAEVRLARSELQSCLDVSERSVMVAESAAKIRHAGASVRQDLSDFDVGLGCVGPRAVQNAAELLQGTRQLVLLLEGIGAVVCGAGAAQECKQGWVDGRW
jgi:hypothetical protein